MADKKQKQGQSKGGKQKQGKAPQAPVKYTREQPPRLKRLYREEVVQRLMQELELKNPMEVPRLVKVTINMGLGRAAHEPKILDSAAEELRAIAGQAPVITGARKDIASFKLRRGNKIGCMVTLRRERMWEFLDRLVNIALPRVRDFRGISSKAFDGRGNFSLGVREQIIFPEIDYDKIDTVKGMNVTIVTTAKTDAEGRALLKHLGMPFRGASASAQQQGAQA